MPLSTPAARDPLHTRTVTCRGFQRHDGQWEVEGHMTDVKSYDFPNRDRDGIPAGEPVHGMWLRITLNDALEITAAEAHTEYSPFTICGDIAEAYRALVGLQIGPGFNRKVKTLFAGRAGCTHLSELLGPMATTVYQTVIPMRERKRRESQSPETKSQKPGILGQCYALREDGPVVARDWPDFAEPTRD